ncbi:hypothetical protein GCG54_00004963 [Colletotrichum gloeosporioides]|uniref:Uncharacterized protein n=1 Tax=Colletotrichum gloeosporioides TaxID=474922 RepID=A0A8H4CGZ6_COLGL|nr:uncharacterized protein GCG54_00004963 [Colletotrichum gloeosporioides]KAF3803783.1 hypothetical protein GCG54_00004963 [Colletotrichum gloeosporioides]
MRFTPLSITNVLFYLLPAVTAQTDSCISSSISTESDREHSTTVNFDATTNTYTATVPPGSMTLIRPALNITNNGGYKRLFCLASEPARPQAVSCFALSPHSACMLPDYYGEPFRLDTYRR